ncbi:DUF5067 domain-containing protein [Aerococcaceae bacterium WGS1372]
MSTSKLLIGIFSIVLSIFITFQSLVAGLGNALFENNEVSGTGGVLVAIIMLVTGIVTLVQRHSVSVAPVVLYVIAAVIGYITAGSYSDLYIWSTLCLIFAIIIFFTQQKSKGPTKVRTVVENHTSHHSSKNNSTLYMVLAAIVIVGIADIFFNFSGLNILQNIQSDNANGSEVVTNDEQATPSNIIETDTAIFDIKQVWIEEYKYTNDTQIVFEYEFTNKSDEPVGVDTEWLYLFSAIQDNDPNIIKKLSLSSPNQYGLEEYAEVKPGGTMTYGQAYILDDEVTPVLLTATNMLNDKLWEKVFDITNLNDSNSTSQAESHALESNDSLEIIEDKILVAVDILKPSKSKFKLISSSDVTFADNTTNNRQTSSNNQNSNSSNNVASSSNSSSNSQPSQSEIDYWNSMALQYGFQQFNGFGDPNQFIESAKELTYNAETYGYAYYDYANENYNQEESKPEEYYYLFYEDENGVIYENPIYQNRYGPEDSTVSFE